jgi:hypothetical protein
MESDCSIGGIVDGIMADLLLDTTMKQLLGFRLNINTIARLCRAPADLRHRA